MKTQFSCQWIPAFFGLGPTHREDVFLEAFFTCAYYGGISWEVYYNWPLSYRSWFIKRLKKEITQAQENGEQSMPSKAAHHNDPAIRSMANKHRPNIPHNLKRF